MSTTKIPFQLTFGWLSTLHPDFGQRVRSRIKASVRHAGDNTVDHATSSGSLVEVRIDGEDRSVKVLSLQNPKAFPDLDLDPDEAFEEAVAAEKVFSLALARVMDLSRKLCSAGVFAEVADTGHVLVTMSAMLAPVIEEKNGKLILGVECYEELSGSMLMFGINPEGKVDYIVAEDTGLDVAPGLANADRDTIAEKLLRLHELLNPETEEEIDPESIADLLGVSP